MPQDVTFDLPFETPVSEHPEFARAPHPYRMWGMDPVNGKAGFEEYPSWDLPQAVAALPDRSKAGLIGHTGRPASDPPAFPERPRASDPGVALRLLGRECFLIDAAETAVQVLVL
ncbi:hypothetical protein [Streptomyces sp. NPDC054804]